MKTAKPTTSQASVPAWLGAWCHATGPLLHAQMMILGWPLNPEDAAALCEGTWITYASRLACTIRWQSLPHGASTLARGVLIWRCRPLPCNAIACEQCIACRSDGDAGRRQQLFELAGAVRRHRVVAAAQEVAVDEHLQNEAAARRSPICAIDMAPPMHERITSYTDECGPCDKTHHDASSMQNYALHAQMQQIASTVLLLPVPACRRTQATRTRRLPCGWFPPAARSGDR